MKSEIEKEFLDRLLDPVTRCLPPESARLLVDLKADPEAQARIDFLSDKANNGDLSQEEREEYEAYISAANVLAVLQAKARRILATNAA